MGSFINQGLACRGVACRGVACIKLAVMFLISVIFMT
jgi:hypothetical protein